MMNVNVTKQLNFATEYLPLKRQNVIERNKIIRRITMKSTERDDCIRLSSSLLFITL